MTTLTALMGAVMLVSLLLFVNRRKRRPLGIPKLAWERAGIALLCFSWGYENGIKLWFFLLMGILVPIAIVVDPYILPKLGCISERIRIRSLTTNTVTDLIMLSTYSLGALAGIRTKKRSPVE